jgi:hypothetical protein
MEKASVEWRKLGMIRYEMRRVGGRDGPKASSTSRRGMSSAQTDRLTQLQTCIDQVGG